MQEIDWYKILGPHTFKRLLKNCLLIGGKLDGERTAVGNLLCRRVLGKWVAPFGDELYRLVAVGELTDEQAFRHAEALIGAGGAPVLVHDPDLEFEVLARLANRLYV